jgi:cellulose synthase/poly-beta-1,6-N-acetylglucosamine synthase-like glycosyltransferase
MIAAVAVALSLMALVGVPASAYLLLATLLSARPPAPKPSARAVKFDVLVPAHNELPVIERVVRSLKRLDWPADRFRIIVIADNCTDSTATLARNAGALVFERHDSTLRGKGYALAYAFARSAAEGWADAVVVIDADAEVSTNLLESFAARIEAGAPAIQAHYGVLNPMASWRTRLMTIATAAFHIVRSRARERLGLSCGIRGNGWCVTHRLLERVPYQAYSLAEDLEYGIAIGLAGFRVHYADEAHSNADMVSSAQIADKQRQRWERGRFELIRAKTAPLLRAALARRSAICLDLALDLLVLPLSYVALSVIALCLCAAVASWWQSVLLPWLFIGLSSLGAIALYVLRGWQLSGVGARGLVDLARAPLFLVWKVLLMLKRKTTDEWIRTERERH